MNIKSKAGLVTLTTFLLWAIGFGIVGGYAGIDKFRHRKAIETCVENGQSNCADKVNAMSKEEVLEYIKDK